MISRGFDIGQFLRGASRLTLSGFGLAIVGLVILFGGFGAPFAGLGLFLLGAVVMGVGVVRDVLGTMRRTIGAAAQAAASGDPVHPYAVWIRVPLGQSQVLGALRDAARAIGPHATGAQALPGGGTVRFGFMTAAQAARFRTEAVRIGGQVVEPDAPPQP